MIEIWKPVVGHAGYEVSSLGRVRSLDRVDTYESTNQHASFTVTRRLPGKILNLTPNKKRGGHLHVKLGRGTLFAVHRLVLDAFVGPCPEGMEALHGSAGEDKNYLDNLRWGTRSENLKEDYQRGVRPAGEDHQWSVAKRGGKNYTPRQNV